MTTVVAESAVATLVPAIELENHKKDIEFFVNNSTVDKTGENLTMTQGKFEEWSASHGVERSDIERVKNLLERADVAKVAAAATLLEKNIKDKIEAGEDASALSATFSTRDVAFKHSAKVVASKSVMAAPPVAGEEIKRKTVYGTASSTVSVRGKLPEELVSKTSDMVRKALGI